MMAANIMGLPRAAVTVPDGAINVIWPDAKDTTGSPATLDPEPHFSLLDSIVAYTKSDVAVQLLDSLIQQREPLSKAVERADVAFQILSSFYCIRDSGLVREFLGLHPQVRKLLFAAYSRVKQTWGVESRADLQLFRDPEDESVSLVVYVISTRADAYPLLDRFDEEWWLSQAGKSDGLLAFAVQ